MDIYYAFLFIFGLLIGSFLNVVIYRETNDDKKTKNKKDYRRFLPAWVTGRSYCDQCRRPISWYDNIPLLSFLILQGRCRHCGKPISIQYPLIEIMTAFEFIWLYWLLQKLSFFGRIEGFYSFALLAYWIYIFSSLLVIFIIDLRSYIIPDWVVIPAIMISSFRLFESARWQYVVAAVCAGGFFYFLHLVTKGKGLGLGDVKFALLMGLFLGFPGIVVGLFTAFLTGAFVAVILVLSGRKKFGQKVPFGPFLVLGTIVAKLYGQEIWTWYLNLMKG